MFRPIYTPIEVIDNYDMQIEISSSQLLKLEYKFLETEDNINKINEITNQLISKEPLACSFYIIMKESLKKELRSIYNKILEETKNIFELKTQKFSYVETHQEPIFVPAKYP